MTNTTYRRYTATRDTISAYRELSPLTLEHALHVDTDSCVYADEPPADVIAACPIVTAITEDALADLRGEG